MKVNTQQPYERAATAPKMCGFVQNAFPTICLLLCYKNSAVIALKMSRF